MLFKLLAFSRLSLSLAFLTAMLYAISSPCSHSHHDGPTEQNCSERRCQYMSNSILSVLSQQRRENCNGYGQNHFWGGRADRQTDTDSRSSRLKCLCLFVVCLQKKKCYDHKHAAFKKICSMLFHANPSILVLRLVQKHFFRLVDIISRAFKTISSQSLRTGN